MRLAHVRLDCIMMFEDEHNLPKLGFLYHYPSLDHPTDKFRLDIFISSVPTEKHFDVLHVILNIESQYGGLERFKITHPWEYQSPYRVCPGTVIMEDRKGKKVEAFCFGGNLVINKKDSFTECFLSSPAPILEFDETNPMKVLLIEKVEILLAEYRAGYTNDQDFEKDLCSTAPLDLYTACLTSLTSDLRSKAQKNDQDLQFLNYLHKEDYRLGMAGLIDSPAPGLDDIFKK